MIRRYVLRDAEKTISPVSLFSVLVRPIVTEKSTSRTGDGQYFFEVARWANKIQIKKAVEHIFSVRVHSVNTLVLKGKVKRFRGRVGKRSDVKKAMVSLEPGQMLDFLDGGKVS